MGAFVEAVRILAAYDVPTIPTRQDAPAMPMVKRPGRFGVSASLKLAENFKFQEANAAIWAGATSGLTIVDIDSVDPRHTAEALKAFGDTPLKVSTPSGGMHLYYRYGGEGRSIRPFGQTLPLDVLGNGLAVVPPSRRPATSKKTAGAYELLEGDFSDLYRLPEIPHGTVPSRTKTAPHISRGPVADFGALREGDGRDVKLFGRARALAVNCETEAELIEAVRHENAAMGEPLPDAVALAKAAGAWKYKTEGRLMVGGSRAAVMGLDAITRLTGHSVAVHLLAYLRSHHALSHRFAIVPESVAPILGQSHNTLRKARETLVKSGFLILERRGGGTVGTTGRGIPNLYRFANAARTL